MVSTPASLPLPLARAESEGEEVTRVELADLLGVQTAEQARFARRQPGGRVSVGLACPAGAYTLTVPETRSALRDALRPAFEALAQLAQDPVPASTEQRAPLLRAA